ncbi:MAG: amino acid racemase [Rubrivivax sp.]
MSPPAASSSSGFMRGLPQQPRPLGILGGMGPLATVDFLDKLVRATPAGCDQAHIPLLVRFCPEVPDRVGALLHGTPSPAPALVAAALSLQGCGVQALAMACNTAYAWYDDLAAALSIPVLHIVDSTLQRVHDLRLDDVGVGLLATSGALHAGIYRRRAAGAAWIEPSPQVQEACVATGIRAVKAGQHGLARQLIIEAARHLVDRGAGVLVMGCTEVPLALASVDVGVPLVDSSDALAQACVRWALELPAGGP